METILLVTAAVAAFALGARRRATVSVPVGLVAAGALTAANQAAHPGSFSVPNDLVFFLAVVGAPLLVGSLWRSRGHQIRELDRLAARRRDQHAADLHAARLEEQTRIASQVQHDVIQSMGAIAVSAAGAARTRDAETTGSLLSIETSARSALDALRAHIGVLRETTPAEPEAASPPAATDRPALGRLDLLAATAVVPLAVESVLGAHRLGPAWLNVVLALFLAPALVVRRRQPLAAVTAGFGVTALASTLATPPATTVSAMAPVLLLSYSVGAHQRGWPLRAAGLALLWSGVVLVGLATPAALRDVGALAPVLTCTGLVVAGGVLAAGRADRVQTRARLLAELDRGRAAELRLAAAQERHAIARDLHDSVAATMTVVCLHAAAARRAPRGDAVHEALRTIESAARAGLTELRGSLDLLDGEDSRRPEAPDLPLTLGAVLEGARSAGMCLRVDLDEAGPVEEVAPLAVRIVREGLVNAARHAPGTDVTVRVARGRDGVHVEVRDTGPSASAAFPAMTGTGHGLAGLGERVRSAGGTLRHGPVDGGYRLVATVPVTPAVDRPAGGAGAPGAAVPA